MFSFFSVVVLSFFLQGMDVVFAGENVPDHVRIAITHALKSSPVGEISPIKQIRGLYEVQTGNNIVYATGDGRYIFFGIILDSSSSVNLTAARMIELHKQLLKNGSSEKLTRTLSFSIGYKKGKVQSLFVDMTQHESRAIIRRAFKSGTKFAVYMLPMSLINPLADEMAKSIWCGKNRVLALKEASERERILVKPRDHCVAPIREWRDLAARFNISGPPSLIDSSGNISSLITE